MKKLLRILALLCALCLLLGLGVSAEGENWSEEYYRIIDYTDTLTDEAYLGGLEYIKNIYGGKICSVKSLKF